MSSHIGNHDDRLAYLVHGAPTDELITIGVVLRTTPIAYCGVIESRTWLELPSICSFMAHGCDLLGSRAVATVWWMTPIELQSLVDCHDWRSASAGCLPSYPSAPIVLSITRWLSSARACGEVHSLEFKSLDNVTIGPEITELSRGLRSAPQEPKPHKSVWSARSGEAG